MKFLIYCKKYLIVIKEKTYDKNIEIRFRDEILILSEDKMLLIPKTETAAKVGIDNKKEILAASYLLKF